MFFISALDLVGYSIEKIIERTDELFLAEELLNPVTVEEVGGVYFFCSCQFKFRPAVVFEEPYVEDIRVTLTVHIAADLAENESPTRRVKVDSEFFLCLSQRAFKACLALRTEPPVVSHIRGYDFLSAARCETRNLPSGLFIQTLTTR